MGQIDRDRFYQELRDRGLADPVVIVCMEPVLDAWLQRDTIDTRFLAFTLAAAYYDSVRFYDGDPYGYQGTDRLKAANRKLAAFIDGSANGHKLNEYLTPTFSCWTASVNVLPADSGITELSWADICTVIGACLVAAAIIAMPVRGTVDTMPAVA